MEFLNRRNYEPLLDWIEKTKKVSPNLTVVLLDIDHFHKIRSDLSTNQRLQNVFEILQNNLPEPLIYLGLDEFAIYSTENRPEDLFFHLTLAKNQLEQNMQMTFSAGIAEYPKHGEDAIEVMRHLEETVYLIKKEGRNRIAFGVERKMKLKSNYYTLTQFDRLTELSKELGRSEASLLRESLDLLFRRYEK